MLSLSGVAVYPGPAGNAGGLSLPHPPSGSGTGWGGQEAAAPTFARVPRGTEATPAVPPRETETRIQVPEIFHIVSRPQ